MDNTIWGIVFMAVGAALAYGSELILKWIKKPGSKRGNIVLKSVGLVLVMFGAIVALDFIKLV